MVPVGHSLSLPVSFKPTEITDYIGAVVVKSGNAKLGQLKVNLSGSGYQPGRAPELLFVSSPEYGGQNGVSPKVGPAGQFTYSVVYRSADNVEPMHGYPKVGVDKNMDNDFNDLGESLFEMSKVGTGTNWKEGVTYTFTTYLPVSNLYGYQFFATDAKGNSTTSGANLYISVRW